MVVRGCRLLCGDCLRETLEPDLDNTSGGMYAYDKFTRI